MLKINPYKKYIIFWIVVVFVFFTIDLKSQEPINIFGSIQSLMFNEDNETKLVKPFDSTLSQNNRSSFALQQMNLFFNKSLLDKFKVFIDLEFKLNYSSSNDWGDFNVQEAWISYDYSDKLIVKAGLLYPKFNNLNEIKNKLALLPTIFRPSVYEGLYSNILPIEDFIPEKAFIQISGSFPTKFLLFDYAAYMGNAENSYIVSNKKKYSYKEKYYFSGTDITDLKLKLFGGRLGLRKNDESFKIGVSLAHDYDNKRDTTWLFMKLYKPPFGDLSRWKLGFDLSFNFWKLEVESEYINVFYNIEHSFENIDFDKQFFYLMLLANATEDLYVYGRYQLISDEFLQMDAYGITGGIGYKLNDFTTLKFEWMKHLQNHKFSTWQREIEIYVNYYVFGVSAFF